MAGEWETVPLEQLTEHDRGISYGIVQPGSPVRNGVPIVRVRDVRDGRISTAEPLRVSPRIESMYGRTRLRGGELLLTLVGTVGETAVVPPSLAGWNTARAVAVILVRQEIGAYWVQIALRSPQVQQIIDSGLNTTVQATLNLGDLAQIPIVLPSKAERGAIAHILGTLDVAFFQAVRAALAKSDPDPRRSTEELDQAIRQIVSKAVVSDQVVDIFAAAGLKKPDISILSDEFLAEVRRLPQRNLAVELLRKLLNNEIKDRSRKNVVLGRSFADMLERSIRAYQNRAVETAQVIEELIELAREMREAQQRGERLGLTDDEVAFYDALEVNDSAVKVLGEETLKAIARELVASVRRTVTIDWTVRESVRARMRVMVKRILKKYGYPPDKQESATKTVLEQAEVICAEWAA